MNNMLDANQEVSLVIFQKVKAFILFKAGTDLAAQMSTLVVLLKSVLMEVDADSGSKS